jgi:hypothetical protein
MANGIVDFGWLAQLPDQFAAGQQYGRQRQFERGMAGGLPRTADGNIDFNAAVDLAARTGNVGALRSFASLASDQRDYQFRRDEAKRTQSNADRTFDFQKTQADVAGRGYDYRETDDGSGGKTLIRINKQTGQAERVPVAGQENTPLNPYVAGKQNESQATAGLYANRMIASERILRDPSVVGAATSVTQRGLGAVPFAGNFLVSEAYQKFDQAQRDFINAVLRRESGAVISDQEFDNARKQYFPQPGDTQERIAQKQRNRAEAIRGIGAAGGPGYRPDHILSPDGQIIVNPAKGRAPAQQPSQKTAPVMPTVGEVRDGYRYNGGNPADPNSWVKQ